MIWIKRPFRALSVLLSLLAMGAGGVSPRVISASEAKGLILEDLANRAPRFVALLDEATMTAGVRDLQRARLWESIYTYKTDCCGTRSMLVLTEEGQRVAADHGWAVDRNTFQIPLGRFVYIANSLSVKYDNGLPSAIAFRYQFEPNFNVHYLLSIGKASDWCTEDGRTLSDMGKTLTKTVFLRFEERLGWTFYDNRVSAPPRAITC